MWLWLSLVLGLASKYEKVKDINYIEVEEEKKKIIEANLLNEEIQKANVFVWVGFINGNNLCK